MVTGGNTVSIETSFFWADAFNLSVISFKSSSIRISSICRSLLEFWNLLCVRSLFVNLCSLSIYSIAPFMPLMLFSKFISLSLSVTSRSVFIAVKGVFSSCAASEMNLFCLVIISSIGLRVWPAKK